MKYLELEDTEVLPNKITYETDYNGYLEITTPDGKRVNITYFNGDTNEKREFVLKKKKFHLMKGKIKGAIKYLPEVLVGLGVIVGAGALTYGTLSLIDIGKEVIEELDDSKKINDSAKKSVAYNARSIDKHVQMEFLREVQANLFEKEKNNSLTPTDEMLLPELNMRLEEISKSQNLYEEAIALGNIELASNFKNNINGITEELTIRCGQLGHIIGSTDYYPYLNAIYHDGQVMYLEDDLTDNDNRVHVCIKNNGSYKYYVPSEKVKIEGMHKVD